MVDIIDPIPTLKQIHICSIQVQLSANLSEFLFFDQILFFSLSMLIKQNECHLKIKITFPIVTSTKWQILKEAKNLCWHLRLFDVMKWIICN